VERNQSQRRHGYHGCGVLYSLFMCIGWLTVIFANLGFMLAGVSILILLFCRCLLNEHPVGITLDRNGSAFLFCGTLRLGVIVRISFVYLDDYV